MKKTTKGKNTGLTPIEVRELAETVVGSAINVQARELESHMQSIHDRLVALEKQVGLSNKR
tara:strand:- start:220 stop:402 length:183 start_codon:yes stop_codon:yes gene_type:complete